MNYILTILHDIALLTKREDFWGYVGGAFTLATFSMSSMRWLRVMAVGSNLAYIFYGLFADLVPVWSLDSILLPVNAFGFWRIERARRSGKRLLAQSAAPIMDEALSKPIYLNANALADPATALSLAEREQQRVACRLAARLISGDDTTPAAQTEASGRAAAVLLDEIDRFLSELAAGRSLSTPQAVRLTGLQSRDEVLRSLHETLGDLAGRLNDPTTHLPERLAVTLREGLGVTLLMAEDAARSSAPEDIDLLLSVTLDRGAMVEQIRSQAMVTRTDGDTSDHRAIYVVTALYERTVWLLRRYGTLLEAGVAPTA